MSNYSIHPKKFLNVLFFLTNIFYASSIFSDLSIPINSTLDKDIQQLENSGLLKLRKSFRPYSRRLIADHLKNITLLGNEDKATITSFNRLNSALSLESKTKWHLQDIEELHFFLSGNTYPLTAFPLENGVDSIRAKFNRFQEFEEGNQYDEGLLNQVQSTHYLKMPFNFGLFIQPNFQWGLNTQPQSINLHKIYLSTTWKNFNFKIGKDHIITGQSHYGGLTFSSHPSPIPIALVSTKNPFKVPIIHHLIGENHFKFYYGNLGPKSFFPYSHITSLQYFIYPNQNFEIGVHYTNHFGGNGAPKISLVDGLQDFFGFIPILHTSAVPISDRVFGIDMRLTIPKLNDLQLYIDYAMEDKTIQSFDAFFSKTLIQDSSYIFGLYLPRWQNNANLNFTIEFVYTGLRYSGHGIFLDGNSINETLWGHPIGPDSIGIYPSFEIKTFFPITFFLNFAHFKRNNKQYQFAGSSIKEISSGDNEFSTRSMFELAYNYSSKFVIQSILAHNYTKNFNFDSNKDTHDFYASIKFTYIFPPFR